VNLIHSAIDAIPEEKEGTIIIKVDEAKSNINVTIRDNGIRIPDTM
jgi:C4-dicarboxylate-specific signal transduction histidine kinase